jgi:phosphopentomutase
LRRAFVVVLDACGIGALPDAADYGDGGADTLGNLAQVVGGLKLPTLGGLGLGSIAPLAGVAPATTPVLHGSLHPLGYGKDSTAGHWELMGVVQRSPLPTYPAGFPPGILELIVSAAGSAVLCNRPSNGIEAIEAYGEEHLRTGSVIVYTSQDSVLQIAAHLDVLAPEELYSVCSQVRQRLPPEHAVGRVIARPFEGSAGHFKRTDGRRDFSLAPPSPSYLQELGRSGVEVHTVGKVGQLFAGVGVDVQHPGPTNVVALEQTAKLIETLEGGLVFTNLIDTDQVYGHRHDVEGFHRALREIDGSVAGWLERLGQEDLLVLTADHGCDPTSSGTDHTRERAPLLAVFEGHGSRRHDGAFADVGASVLRWLTGRDSGDLPGVAFT